MHVPRSYEGLVSNGAILDKTRKQYYYEEGHPNEEELSKWTADNVDNPLALL